MSKILIVTSSVRQSRIADRILETVKAQVVTKYPRSEITVADFREMPLPFFDAPVPPAHDDFRPTDANVIAWTKMVNEADAVVMLVAEYNHGYTAVLKNAIDWIYKPWIEKPIALVGYGWVGGARATTHLRGVLGSNIATKTIETEANLRFTKEIDLDGSIIDAPATETAIDAVLEELRTVL